MAASSAVPEAPEAAPKGFLARLRARLGRSGELLARDLRGLFTGRKIDAALLEELEEKLLAADLGVTVTGEVLEELRQQVARRELADGDALMAALRARLTAILQPCEQALDVRHAGAKPYVILVVGVNGSGKTTTIGKLATRLGEQGLKVMLAAGDTFRAAAIEQLGIWGERSGAAVSAQQSGADPGAVVFDALQSARARGYDVLIADTAGRLQNQSHLMDELRKVKRVLGRVDPAAPHEVLLVLDANQGQNALAQAEQFHAAVGVTGLVITKLDGTARGGIVVAIARRLGLPIRFIGLGEGADDFGRFEAAPFAAALLGGGEPRGARVIRFEAVGKRYRNGREALAGVSLHVAPGEMVFLTGRSGAGKSTVLRLIALLERPTRGEVVVGGQGTARLPARKVPAYRRGIGVVFQDHRLLADRPVYDNVALPLVVAHTSLKETDKRVRAALDQVGLLGHERVLPSELSVGEQQRVGIARAIVSRPPLLIADEPTGNLDPQLAGEVFALFRRLNEVGVTVVVATHDVVHVQASGLREIVLEAGRVIDAHPAALPVVGPR